MALACKASLGLLRGTLRARGTVPGLAQAFIPYACSIANSLLQGVENKGLQDQLIRKGLLAPSERAEDMALWADDNATRAWLRKWWLSNTYRGTARYHAASAALFDQNQLPTIATTRKIF